jgi:hypothetical protein
MQSELMSDARGVPGFVGAYCVAPDPATLVMVVVGETPESVEALHQQVGSPWIGANLRPYVAQFDRRVGPVVAGT